jgi:hypothetical protein
MGWSWEKGTPKERADTVRAHWHACLANKENLAELFNLTPAGVDQIMHGDVWRPEYRQNRVNTRIRTWAK